MYRVWCVTITQCHMTCPFPPTPCPLLHTCHRFNACCSASSRPSEHQGSNVGAVLNLGRSTAAAAALPAMPAPPPQLPMLLRRLPPPDSADAVRRCRCCSTGEPALLLLLPCACHTTAASKALQAALWSLRVAMSCLQQPSMPLWTCTQASHARR
jgi:hypothetical protein